MSSYKKLCTLNSSEVTKHILATLKNCNAVSTSQIMIILSVIYW